MPAAFARAARCIASLFMGALVLGGCALTTGPGTSVDAGAASRQATIMASIDYRNATVALGEEVSLWVETNFPASGLRYNWRSTSGQLSSSTGERVRWRASQRGRAQVFCTVLPPGLDFLPAEYSITPFIALDVR